MQENNNDDDSMPLTKTKTKKSEEKPNLKKVRSDKQIAAFNKTMEIRKQKVEERKNQKLLESAKILVEKHGKKDDQPKNNKITPFQKYADSLSFSSKKDKVTLEKNLFSNDSSEGETTAPSSSSGEETEEEIIVVKNKPKIKQKVKYTKEKHKKKPSRKTIIFDSSDDSSSDSSDGGSDEYLKVPKRTTHERVKRKDVVEQPPIKQLSKPEDFRVYFI